MARRNHRHAKIAKLQQNGMLVDTNDQHYVDSEEK